jgi:hypothetical protein
VLIFIYERNYFLHGPISARPSGGFQRKPKDVIVYSQVPRKDTASMFGAKCHRLVSLADEARLKGRWQLGDKSNDAPLRSALYSNITPSNWQIKPNETSITKKI